MARAWLIAVVAASACSASPSGPSLAPPLDGGSGDGSDEPVPPGDAAIDAPGDAAIDVPPSDLAELCGGAAPVTLDDWEACYRKRKCEWEVGCFPSYPYRDVADCIADGDDLLGGGLAAERRERKRAVEQGRAALDVAAFTQCIVRTSATRCNTALHEPACATRFTGTVPDGGDCLTDIDCASPGAVCSADCKDACCAGTCERKLRTGEACQLAESCEPGLVCTGTRCVTGDAGTPCDRGSVNQCDFGTFCDGQTLRCTPTRAPGAECTSLLQCGEDHTCVGLLGNPPRGRCMRISRPGDQCDSFCFGNLTCDRSTRPPRCRSLPGIGQTCSLFLACAGTDIVCDSEVCGLRTDVGMSCNGRTCLPGLFCTSELGEAMPVCAERRAAGMACSDPGHCQSYLCSGSAGQPGECLAWRDSCRRGD